MTGRSTAELQPSWCGYHGRLDDCTKTGCSFCDGLLSHDPDRCSCCGRGHRPEPTTAARCTKGGTPHLLRDHGTDGHEHAHNPWTAWCVKRLPGEPSCPDARCMSCDRWFARTEAQRAR